MERIIFQMCLGKHVLRKLVTVHVGRLGCARSPLGKPNCPKTQRKVNSNRNWYNYNYEMIAAPIDIITAASSYGEANRI